MLSLAGVFASAQAQRPVDGPSASAQAPAAGALLNSERIEARFGSYGIDVLSSDERFRLSNLYSTDGPRGERTTRTLALVEYPPVIPPGIESEHATILAGGSIGATFEAAGWRVIKTNLYLGERRAGPALQRLMRLDGAATVAMHVYQLDVARDGRRVPYVRILELHHPDYLTARAVRKIYAPGWKAGDNADVAGLSAVLEIRGY